MKSMAFVMDTESFVRSIWLRFGMNPPNRVFITSSGRLYIVIDDNGSIIRAMDKNGNIILVVHDNLEIVDDNYYRMIRPDRFKYYGCGYMNDRDVIVKYMIYPLLFLRSK